MIGLIIGQSVFGESLDVVFIDLDTKGESILVLYPDGKTMLIDGGMSSSYPKLESILKQYNVTNIDVMIATHADEDHIGGLNEVIDSFKVGKVLVSSGQSETKTYSSFVSRLVEKEVVFDGYIIDTGNVHTEIISPSPNGLPSAQDATLSNSNSLVTLVEYGDISFLFNSDATSVTEEYIVANHPVDVDIMTSPHHGSKFSSTDVFLKVTSPELIIISANEDNQYKHPDKSVISKYDSRAIKHYQTGIDGTIVIKTDGVGCSVMFDIKDSIPCYNGVQMILEYNNAVRFCDSRDKNKTDDCDGWLRISKNGYYDYKTGVVKSVIESFDTARVSLPKNVWLVPDWVVNIQYWYDNGVMTPDEFDNALQYLIDKGIAKYQRI